MEEAAELADYLPLSFMSRRDGIPWDKTPKEQEYIEFLWDAFETNHTHGKYQFAFLARHMLTMSFVSQHLADQADDAKGFRDGPDRLQQGHREDPARCDFALRVQRRERTQHPALAQAHRPRQSKVPSLDSGFRRNDALARASSVVRIRAAGNPFQKITEIMRVVAEIQARSRPVIEHCYREVVLQNHDPDGHGVTDADTAALAVQSLDSGFRRNDALVSASFVVRIRAADKLLTGQSFDPIKCAIEYE